MNQRDSCEASTKVRSKLLEFIYKESMRVEGLPTTNIQQEI